jgi:hypothetical protein
MKKLLSRTLLLTVTLCLLFAGLLPASAEETRKFTLRIEGISATLFDKEVSVPFTGSLTLQDALIYVDQQEAALTFVGVETAYITSICGEDAGRFGGYDGWLYLINGADPYVGIESYDLEENDAVVLYYGDPFGLGFQYPELDASKIGEGILRFTSEDAEYDAEFNVTYKTNPVAGATVTWYTGAASVTYTTDSDGCVKIDAAQLTVGSHKVQINKYSAEGLPLVLRLSANTAVNITESGGTTSTTTTTTSTSETTTTTEASGGATTTATPPPAGETTGYIPAIILLCAAVLAIAFVSIRSSKNRHEA